MDKEYMMQKGSFRYWTIPFNINLCCYL